METSRFFDIAFCPDGREHDFGPNRLVYAREGHPMHGDWTTSACVRCGVMSLESLGPDKLAALPYQRYLKTLHWRERRLDAVEEADYRCRLCNSGAAPLHVHHRTYERRGDEHPADLIALCAECHARFHQRAGVSRQRGPRKTASVAVFAPRRADDLMSRPLRNARA